MSFKDVVKQYVERGPRCRAGPRVARRIGVLGCDPIITGRLYRTPDAVQASQGVGRETASVTFSLACGSAESQAIASQ